MHKRFYVSLAGGVALTLLTLFITLNLSVTANSRAVQPPVFTGDAAADFTDPSTIVFEDRAEPGDVDLPDQFPTSTISGFDIRALYMLYDDATDVMYVGIDCFVICGDTDGDGDPSGTGEALAGAGGTDEAEFGPGESFGLLIDTDNDYDGTTGDFDVVVGVNEDDSLANIGAFNYDGAINQQLLFETWLERLPISVTLYASPSGVAPDLEFAISNFSRLPGFPADQPPLNFKISLGMGSTVDDGIGEDFSPGFLAVAPTSTPESPLATPTITNTVTPTTTASPTVTPTVTITPSATVTTTPVTPTPTPTLPPPTQVPTTGVNLFQQGGWNQVYVPNAKAQMQLGPTQLSIPSIGLETTVEDRGWHAVEDATGALISQWDEVPNAAGWHKDSSLPGRQGNVVISGHNNIHGAVFRNLHLVQPGETIYVEYGKAQYAYSVESVDIEQEVGATLLQKAENAAFLAQTDDTRLTLITCWPWYGDSHRVFVVANLTSVKMNVTER